MSAKESFEFVSSRELTEPSRRADGAASLVDTTMLFAPASGGVRRYLLAKQSWFAEQRPWINHSLVLPGESDRDDIRVSLVEANRLPFSRGYRWPMNTRAWRDRLVSRAPSLIEAQDPYVPGFAALDAGQLLSVPVISFCHSDLGVLGPLRLTRWSRALGRRLLASRLSEFDAVLTPSQHLAGILQDAGLHRAKAVQLGVDLDLFSPSPTARAELRQRLGVPAGDRLLVFAGRPSREKRIDVLIEAVERLGAGYRLLLVGAGGGVQASDRVISVPFEEDSRSLAKVLAGCDALVHANPNETLGLIVLEAMACGVPIVGVAAGGVGELVDEAIGQLAQRPDAKSIAEAVEALFSRDLDALSAAARDRAVRRHGWDSVFAELTATYAQLTGDDRFNHAALVEAVA